MTDPQHPPETRAPSAGFCVAARVRAKAEFAAAFERGKRHTHPLMALYLLREGEGARLGLAVSRKVDPRAVARNRIKRVLRDAFRHVRAQLAPGAYVVVVRSATRDVPAAQLRAAFAALLQRAGALPPPTLPGTMPPPSRRPDRSRL